MPWEDASQGRTRPGGGVAAIFRKFSGNLQPFFNSFYRIHPIFPDVNNIQPDGPITASGRRTVPHASPRHYPRPQGALPQRVQQCNGTGGGHEMVTVMECSVVTPEGMGRPGAEKPSRLPLTLADLITAIQDVVGPEDDGLVVATVRDLLRAGRLTGAGPEPVGAPCRARRRGAGKFPFSRVRASARHRMADTGCSDAAATAESGDTTISGRALADRICMATACANMRQCCRKGCPNHQIF
jgi:hypothetical protein